MVRKLFLFLLLVLLTLRFFFFFNTPKPFKEGDEVKITTRIISEPLRGETSQYLKVLGLKMYLPRYPEVFYGDTVVVQGKVTGEVLSGSRVLELKSSQNALHGVRNALVNFFERAFPRPHSSLLAGMAIGSKSGISKEFWEQLRSSGTAHVVVASGTNVSLVASFLIGFLALFAKRGVTLPLTLIGIWMYAVLSGFDAPIVRACLMASVTFGAQAYGRMVIALKALILSAYIMLFINPLWVSDVGFLLSFFATLSLILFEHKVNRFISSIFSKKKLTLVPQTLINDLSTSISAQFGVAPILLIFFGNVNVFSPLINMLVLWTVAPITIIGMIGGMLGILYEPLGKLVLYLAYPFTWVFSGVVQIFS